MDFLNAIILLLNYIFVPALTYGSQLALGAIFVTLIYGILRFANFATGDMMSFGTMFTILFTWYFQSVGISLGVLPTALLAIPFAIIFMIGYMLLIDKFVFQYYRIKKSPPVQLAMVSIGVMFVTQAVVRIIIGPSDRRFFDGEKFLIRAGEFKDMTGLNEGLAIKSTQVITILVTVILVSTLFWFLNKTKTGKSMRAYSDNEDLALLSGIDPKKIVMITWIIAGILATIGGALYGLDKSFKPFTYFNNMLPIFAAAIVGGIGNPFGAFLGGYVIAFSEILLTYAYKKFFMYVLPQSMEPDGLVQLLSTDYKFAVSFSILVIVLLYRPSGIFKGEGVVRKNLNVIAAYSIMMGLIILVGIFQSWNIALSIFNLCLISAVMTMGANIQWGYAGLINFGIMGFTALGGLAAVLISVDPVQEAWRAGGFDILMCLWLIIVMVLVIRFILKNFEKSKIRTYSIAAIIIAGIIIIRVTSEPGIEAIEAVDPAKTGFLGGFGLPIIFSWIVGAFFAGGLAFVIGKVALGLRADYLAIATLLISEIVIAIIKHEDWLTRGVKNVIGLKRPAPYEVNLQQTDWFINLVEKFNSSKLNLISDLAERQAALNQFVIEGSSIFVKLCYSGLFLVVVIILLILTQKALYSPWGRMMRAIRDNEEAANAMGKNVVKQHLLIFVLGSAIVGIAGAMLVTQDGLFTPGSYRPLRYTFLIWVMVIIGGSGNNFGAILGGFVVWFLWIEAAPIGLYLVNLTTAGLDDTHFLKVHLIESVPYFRFLMMGIGLLLIMRYRPKGILPEKIEIK